MLQTIRNSEAYKVLADISLLHWLATLIISAVSGSAAGKYWPTPYTFLLVFPTVFVLTTTVFFFREKSKRLRPLAIHWAGYGHSGIDRQHYLDVTLKIQAHIKQNRVSVPVSNTTFDADPHPGIKKILIVRYSSGHSFNKEIVRNENDHLVLPEPDD